MKKGKGSTIIEMILYMGLLSIFLVVLTGIFTSTMSLKLESESTSALNQDGRFLLARLSYDFGGADSISLPANLGEESESLALTKGGQTFVYSVSDGNLAISEGGIQSNLNGPDTRVTGLSFRKIGNAGGKATIKAVITLESRIAEGIGNRSIILQSGFGVRN